MAELGGRQPDHTHDKDRLLFIKGNNEAIDREVADREVTERIDTSVQVFSYWQGSFIILFVSFLFIISIWVGLSVWLFLAVLSIVVVTLFAIYNQSKQLVYLTSPKLYHQTTPHRGNWQLLFQVSTQRELWEAKLLQCRRYGRCIQLYFLIKHPTKIKVSLVIWQDQVQPNAWRRLCVLSRW